MLKTIGKFFIQLYLNECEKDLLGKLETPNVEGVRIRAPFSITNPEGISIGAGTEFLKYSRINLYPEHALRAGNNEAPKLIIGKNCYFCNRVSILGAGSIKIGNNVLVADDVTIVSHDHGIDPESKIPYMDQNLRIGTIVVGNNCWIGEKAVITEGVTIGNGCVIGAMSVVTKDIPDYCMAVGVPAKVIKKYDFDLHKWVRV